MEIRQLLWEFVWKFRQQIPDHIVWKIWARHSFCRRKLKISFPNPKGVNFIITTDAWRFAVGSAKCKLRLRTIIRRFSGKAEAGHSADFGQLGCTALLRPSQASPAADNWQQSETSPTPVIPDNFLKSIHCRKFEKIAATDFFVYFGEEECRELAKCCCLFHVNSRNRCSHDERQNGTRECGTRNFWLVF